MPDGVVPGTLPRGHVQGRRLPVSLSERTPSDLVILRSTRPREEDRSGQDSCPSTFSALVRAAGRERGPRASRPSTAPGHILSSKGADTVPVFVAPEARMAHAAWLLAGTT